MSWDGSVNLYINPCEQFHMLKVISWLSSHWAVPWCIFTICMMHPHLDRNPTCHTAFKSTFTIALQVIMTLLLSYGLAVRVTCYVAHLTFAVLSFSHRLLV